jgi:hypothetical protein
VAELTNLESKLGEVMGLAMAAQAATKKVSGLAEDEGDSELVAKLQRMHQEAAETETRCMSIVETLEGKKTAIQKEAAATKRKGAEMMKIYLDADSEALDGFEFLVMAEAGEVGHWRVLSRMGDRAGDRQVKELCEWAIAIQERHFQEAKVASEELAAAEDPAAVSA